MRFIERPSPPILRDPMGDGGLGEVLWDLSQRLLLW